jgi:hypothetical protein
MSMPIFINILKNKIPNPKVKDYPEFGMWNSENQLFLDRCILSYYLSFVV